MNSNHNTTKRPEIASNLELPTVDTPLGLTYSSNIRLKNSFRDKKKSLIFDWSTVISGLGEMTTT